MKMEAFEILINSILKGITFEVFVYMTVVGIKVYWFSWPRVK